MAYSIKAKRQADKDVEEAMDWYEEQRPAGTRSSPTQSLVQVSAGTWSSPTQSLVQVSRLEPHISMSLTCVMRNRHTTFAGLLMPET